MRPLSRRSLFALPVVLPVAAIAEQLASNAPPVMREWGRPVIDGGADDDLMALARIVVDHHRCWQRFARDLDATVVSRAECDPSDTDPPDVEIDDRAGAWEG